ncbi:MAG: 30S ribosomal protein S16 [Nitrospirae bacterium]|nr:30S ribosomal protein S16 [Nitrospirota bacterium]
MKRGGGVLVKIRLRRLGAHKRPFYRMVVVDSRAKRDGPFIEVLGTYDPLKEPSEIKVNLEKARLWLQKGAQTTDVTKKLLKKAGL